MKKILVHEATQAARRRQIGEQVQTNKAIEAGIQEEHACADTLKPGPESRRAELSSRTTVFGFRLRRILALSISWKNYDDAYKVWKEYRKGNIERHQALKIIGDKYGVRLFFLLYPLYKIVRPFRKFLGRRLIGRPSIRAFDPSKRTMLLVSHEASQSGAPILAFNLLEKFAARYNVISVLLGPGSLENAFRNVSSVTIGPLPIELRPTRHIHKPILNACRKFAPAFAIVNSIQSREALIPLSKAGVPAVLLVHEFVSLWKGLDMPKVVASAGQMVFPARLVWEDAVEAFPPLAGRPANIITQGPCRIPREWLDGETADSEGKRIAEVMRPLGADDNRVVVLGCGIVGLHKGVDLFVSVAAALQNRLPSRRFRFVWAGKEPDGGDYPSLIAAQVNCSGLQETMTFLGEVNSMEPAYAMADIFLLSSRLDPFPNVAIDAMLAGLPVVCFSNASGVAEMLSNRAGLRRLVVPYADAASAAEVIEQLSTDDCYYQATKTAIRDLALSTFDMDRYVASLDQVAERASFIKGAAAGTCVPGVTP